MNVKVRVLYWAPGEIQIKSKALKINILSAFLFSTGIKKAQKKSR
jgi:ABC-type antimicrobial peptide transport system permease subunit